MRMVTLVHRPPYPPPPHTPLLSAPLWLIGTDYGLPPAQGRQTARSGRRGRRKGAVMMVIRLVFPPILKKIITPGPAGSSGV